MRQPHATSDIPSRNRKARKIELLVGLDTGSCPVRLLEVGTGSGGISHYFGTNATRACDVDSVDVHDNRVERSGYRFTQVNDTNLPFGDASFDVVISNHVIEHVGDRHAQRHHLDEMKRVLAPDGIGYLAVPNRWMLVEPHYGVPFLSWLPHSWRSRYLRLTGRGQFYDCEPLQLHELDQLLSEAGLDWTHVEVEAIRVMQSLDPLKGFAGRIVGHLPDSVVAALRPVLPTLICTFRHRRQGSSNA